MIATVFEYEESYPQCPFWDLKKCIFENEFMENSRRKELKKQDVKDIWRETIEAFIDLIWSLK